MAGSDVRDILELGEEEREVVTKEALFNDRKKKSSSKKPDANVKRPEGMHRELWGLLWTDNKDGPPLIPTDTNQGYKQMKAKIGQSKVRPWKWMPFTNPARKDGAIFYHWRRTTDEGKEYPFARFNKQVDMPAFSDLEYQQHLHDENWTRQETSYLWDMAKKFDLRFVVMHDRWDRERYQDRSVEDLKERYYGICAILSKLRDPNTKIRAYDGEHERRRKDQLNKLFTRTTEQIEEEECLQEELKKIEQRKKEREKKTQDLQKLITAADSNMEARRSDRKATKKKIIPQQRSFDRTISLNPESTGIKFPDFKSSGVSLRSQRMKMPSSVGQKKAKAIEQVLEELGLDLNPMPTDDIVTNFNELRQDIVLLYELKLGLANCEYELQTLRHRFETLAPGKMPDLGPVTQLLQQGTLTQSSIGDIGTESPGKTKKISEAIDVLGGTPVTPNRKRKAALEQSNVLKKLKNKM